MRVFNLTILATILALGLGACGRNIDTTNANDTVCRADQAMLSVREGYVRRVCGCAEGAGPVDPPASANCTIRSGQVVFFSFASASGPHQIVSHGTPSFPSSGVSDPRAIEIPLQSHAVRFNQVGSYFFDDAFNGQVHGAIIVQ